MPVDEYALEPNDTTIKAIHELNTRQATQCSSYEDYISKIL